MKEKKKGFTNFNFFKKCFQTSLAVGVSKIYGRPRTYLYPCPYFKYGSSARTTDITMDPKV